MDINRIKSSLSQKLMTGIDVYERRIGNFQLIIPILHEDGDMVDIYIQDSPLGEGYIRVCDFGLTLMRLSYTFDVAKPTRQRILESILIKNDVNNNNGNLYLDAPVNLLYESILQFAGCAQRVCNMRYWSRESIRSAFYDDLKDCVTTELMRFTPLPEASPLPDYPINVDWTLVHNNRNFYVFGVLGNDKAKTVAISLLEFQKARLTFISLVVHEDIEEIGRKESLYLTRNADTQYPVLNDFRERAVADIERIAGVAS